MKLSIPLVSLTNADNKKFCCHCPLTPKVLHQVILPTLACQNIWWSLFEQQGAKISQMQFL